MSLAQRFERRLEGLVGGAFARVFKGQVEPVEIAGALQREAADKRNVVGPGGQYGQGGDMGRVLCPNRYRVTLSPSDHDRLVPWESQLTNSLAELVQEYLDENRWETLGDVEVYLARDDELHTGVFGVASRMEPQAGARQRPHDSLSLPVVPGLDPGNYGGYPDDPGQGGQAQYAPPPAFPAPPAYGAQPAYGPGPGIPGLEPQYGYGDPGRYDQGQYDQGYAPQNPYEQNAYAPAGAGYGGPGGGDQYAPPGLGHAAPRAEAMLIVDQSDRRYDLRPGSNVIGRGTASDLQLLDQGISRRHVDIQFDGTTATAQDLGSTNGTSVNGHEITSQILRHGDVIRVGHTRIVFHQSGAGR